MQSSLRRLDGVAKVTGRLKFSSDMVLPSMLYAVPVLSTEAHARILSVDASEALKLPGCVKVYTGRDVPCNRVGYLHDHPVICDDKVRFYGDIVAVVAAETEEIARRAARLVRVAYEPLPLIETVEQALSLERGKVHDQMENNICHQIHYARGDVDAAFSKCKYIVENEYTFQQVDHCFLETECGVSVAGGRQARHPLRQPERVLRPRTDRRGPGPAGGAGRGHRAVYRRRLRRARATSACSASSALSRSIRAAPARCIFPGRSASSTASSAIPARYA